MARQEATNIFSDGLMSDLHPINTPKSVLTDCLNGTYVTYNGNEFILQNDMGNYKLENCKLPTNFIPVGIKGYGDILYIVSYNPLTKDVEIGSYPAPQSIFVVEDNKDVSTEDEDLTPFDLKLNSNLYYRYPIIINEQKHPLFIFTKGEDSETYKLYPGDEFKLENLDQSPDYIYQHLNFYVIDEDNKLYDLDDNDIYNSEGIDPDNGFRKVFWETPGWLAAQYDLYTPNKFTLNLRSLTVPDFLITKETDTLSEQSDLIFDSSLEEISEGNNQFKVSMDLSAQCIITDKLFQQKLSEHFVEEKKPNEVFEHLFIRFLINTKSDTYGIFKGIMDRNGNEIKYTDASLYNDRYKDPNLQCVDIQCQNHNYQDDIFTTFVNCYAVWFFDILNIPLNAYPYIAEITAFPVIRYNGSELEFTQFSNTLSFPLNTLKDSNDIKIADTVYKWSIDDNSCTLSFNISGPFINAQNITGEYEIYRLNLFQDKIATSFDYSKTKIGKYYNAEYPNTGPEYLLIDNDDLEKWDNALLMLKDTIPNLVLFGQNTININYSDSNVLKVEGKDYKFQAEDGIYLIKFILKQDEEILPILNDTKILIPSAVFNDYFGTIDNYNTLTGDNWLNKYLSYVPDIDVSNFNAMLNENSNVNDAIKYKWENDLSNTSYKPFSEITWGDLNSSLDDIDLSLSFEQKLWIVFYNKYPNFIEYTIKYTNDANNEQKVESITFERTIHKSSPLIKNLQLKVDYTQLFMFDGIPKATLLSGSLWNNLTKYKIQLGNSNSQFQITIDDQGTIDANSNELILRVTLEDIDAPEPGESCYPIMDNLQNNIYLNFRASDKTYDGPHRYDVWYWTGTIQGDAYHISMALDNVTNSTQQVEETGKLDIETESNLVKFTFDKFKNLKFTQGLTFYHNSAEASRMGWEWGTPAIYTSFDRSNIGEAAADDNGKFCAHTTESGSKAKYTGHSKTNYFCVWNDLERYNKRIIVLNFTSINQNLYNGDDINYLPGAIMALCCVKYTPYSDPTPQHYLKIQNLSVSFEESFEFIINSLILNLTVSEYKTDDYTWEINDSVYNLFKVTTLQKINSIYSTVPSTQININLSDQFGVVNSQLNSFLNMTANPDQSWLDKYQKPEFLQVTKDWEEMKQYCEKKYFEKDIPYQIQFLQDKAYTFENADGAYVSTSSCQFDKRWEANSDPYFFDPNDINDINTLKLFKWLFGEDPNNYNRWRFVQDGLNFDKSIKFRCRDNAGRHKYVGEMFYYYEVTFNDINK